MIIVLQRVSRASVAIGGKVVGDIKRGYVVLVSISDKDNYEDARRLAEKIAKLRIFPDENGKINLSAGDVCGELLAVSQFTLYADCKKGNRPSFINAGNPVHAKELFDFFVLECEKHFSKVAKGIFGENMAVELVNDGPFTLVIES